MGKAQIIIHVPGLTAALFYRAAVSTLDAGFSSLSHRWQDLYQAHRAQGDLVAPKKERLDLTSLVEAHCIPYMNHLGPLANGPSRATPDATCFLNYHLRK